MAIVTERCSRDINRRNDSCMMLNALQEAQ